LTGVGDGLETAEGLPYAAPGVVVLDRSIERSGAVRVPGLQRFEDLLDRPPEPRRHILRRRVASQLLPKLLTDALDPQAQLLQVARRPDRPRGRRTMGSRRGPSIIQGSQTMPTAGMPARRTRATIDIESSPRRQKHTASGRAASAERSASLDRRSSRHACSRGTGTGSTGNRGSTRWTSRSGSCDGPAPVSTSTS
jgi:hypothetical protein